MPTITLDDRDPSIIYSSAWRTGGSSTEHNGTTMYTNSSGATATLSFQGVYAQKVSESVSVSGTTRLAQTPPKSTYKLDENEAVTFQPDGIAPQQDYLYYQSGQRLPNKQHTLVVTNMINGSRIFILDYITITTASPAIGGNHIPVIAGSVGGVIAFILLILGAIYSWRRRKRRLEHDRNSSLVPNVWVHSSQSTNPLPPSKNMPPVSLPSTSTHAIPANESDLPAPPAYTTVVCMVTTGTTPRTQ